MSVCPLAREAGPHSASFRVSERLTSMPAQTRPHLQEGLGIGQVLRAVDLYPLDDPHGGPRAQKETGMVPTGSGATTGLLPHTPIILRGCSAIDKDADGCPQVLRVEL